MKPTMAKLVAKLTAARETEDSARVNELVVRVAKRARKQHRQATAVTAKMDNLISKLKAARKQGADSARVNALLVRVADRAEFEERELSPGGSLAEMALKMELVEAHERAAEERRRAAREGTSTDYIACSNQLHGSY